MEVPLIGSDVIQWKRVKVPLNRESPAAEQPCTPQPRDIAGSIPVGGHCDYLIWRIHKDHPSTLEISEWSFKHEPPKFGLQLIFEEPLSPFVFILKQQTSSRTQHFYQLYVITSFGLAYLINLKVLTSYSARSLISNTEISQLDLSKHLHHIEGITAAAAVSGILCIGGHHGYVLCFQFGQFDKTSQDFFFELKEIDARLGRLWGFVRGKSAGEVRDLVILECGGKRLLFVLHDDGNMRIWDLVNRHKIFTHSFTPLDLSGFGPMSLHLGEMDTQIEQISVAIAFRSLSEPATDTIHLYRLDLLGNETGGRMGLHLRQHISLNDGNVIDIKLNSDKLWVLKSDGSAYYELFHAYQASGIICRYKLQDQYIADKLFQGSDIDIDDIAVVNSSLHSTGKGPCSLSSLFLRRLLQPGVIQRNTLKEVMASYNRNFTDPEFRSLTLDGLSKEILNTIESEVVSRSQLALASQWRSFCTRYMQSWNHNNAVYGLLYDSSTSGIGLIRRHAVSVIRGLDEVEVIIQGSPSLPVSWLDNRLDSEVLEGILESTAIISTHLGKAALALFYDSLIKPSDVSFRSVVNSFLKILDVGRDLTILKQDDNHLGIDSVAMKEQRHNQLQRKFSLDIFLSLEALCNQAGGWDRVLGTIEMYARKLIPKRLPLEMETTTTGTLYNINAAVIIQGSLQFADLHFQATCGLLLLLEYLLKLNGQVSLESSHVLQIQMRLIPKVEDFLMRWFLLHWLCATFSESPPVEDFSSELSLLHLDGNSKSRAWKGKLGTEDLTLGGILMFGYPSSSWDFTFLNVGSVPRDDVILSYVDKFASWIFWGDSDDELPSIPSRAIALSSILFQYGQNAVLENLFITVDEQTNESRYSGTGGGTNSDWCGCLHLLGLCFLTRARLGVQEKQKNKNIAEAIRCFFRASSGEDAGKALQHLTFQSSVSQEVSSENAWKLYYFEWLMQIFDQHGLSAGARQFAYAAIEQVDEAFGTLDCDVDNSLIEQACTVKGRLYANVFKFSVDLEQYREAYCAIISNPDEESKHVCLRRFIRVLFEQKALKVLCDCELPFVGLLERVDQELSWKAECSDILAKPNPYKLLYSFHMYRQNWRRAAGCIYRYTSRLKNECSANLHSELDFVLQERLDGLIAAINALHLVDPAYAWLDLQKQNWDRGSLPSKRVCGFKDEKSIITAQRQGSRPFEAADIKDLENEYLLTLAHHHLVIKNVKHPSLGRNIAPPDLVLLLVKSGLNEIALRIISRFWKGSALRRQLEIAFRVMAEQCCTANLSSSANEASANLHLIELGREDQDVDMVNGNGFRFKHVNLKTAWHTLQSFLEKYRSVHSRLPVVVAEALLSTDPLIELPVWLVNIFKGTRSSSWGMAGEEADPAALLRLYVEHGRFSAATYLLLEYIDSWATLRPADIIKRKRMSAGWFPCALVERLYHLLNEKKSSAHLNDQCEKLQKMLNDALARHLTQLRIDSEDAESAQKPSI